MLVVPMTALTKLDSCLSQVFTNKYLKWTCALVTLWAIPSGIYRSFWGNVKPDLTVYLSPNPGVVYRPNDAQGLTLMNGDEVITSEVSTIQFTFWNDGRLPVRASDIRRPLTIRTENSVPILSCRVMGESERPIKLKIDESQKDRGELSLRWEALEKNDGARIQLMIAGPSSTGIIASGVFIGQEQVSHREEQGPVVWAVQVASALGGIFGIMVVVGVRSLATRLNKHEPIRGLAWLFVMSLCSVLYALARIISISTIVPQF